MGTWVLRSGVDHGEGLSLQVDHDVTEATQMSGSQKGITRRFPEAAFFRDPLVSKLIVSQLWETH